MSGDSFETLREAQPKSWRAQDLRDDTQWMPPLSDTERAAAFHGMLIG